MKVCAFCQQEATLTGEHVWSDWVNQLLPYKKGYIGRRIDTVEGTIREEDRKALNLKAKVVCGKCNSGWMSELENKEAKPLIGPMIAGIGPFCLTRLGITSLALFAFKTAVIVDHMRVGAKWAPFFSPRSRERFYRHLEIPPRVQMWIATRVQSQTIGICNLSYEQVRRGAMRGFEMYALTYSIESFMFQVVSFRWTRKAPLKGVGQLIQDENMNTVSPQFWPYNGQIIVWPRDRKIGRDSINVFSNRWRSLSLVEPRLR